MRKSDCKAGHVSRIGAALAPSNFPTNYLAKSFSFCDMWWTKDAKGYFFNILLGRRGLLKDHKDGGVQTRGEWAVSTGHWLLGSDFSLGIGKKAFYCIPEQCYLNFSEHTLCPFSLSLGRSTMTPPTRPTGRTETVLVGRIASKSSLE